ncbi:UDP-glucose:glycoprotein glucosyltransferase 1-like [Nilaparvata lugens]|uniref:UDP-glucose:glycoprotein glucosyltransferase 1-like n=1 Tax=Nilaparvata lugens TaxID=108931 RepID=UPI00193D3E24|nr:UDP-glucose:glycoprotein glucosyltransferase 1-like [Nilaparvata lugens]
MPLKSFYRYVLEPEVQFTADGHLASGPYAKFTNMPGAPLLTQNMHVPENWLVESIVSPYDLDNIRLEEVESAVHSQFELEHCCWRGTASRQQWQSTTWPADDAGHGDAASGGRHHSLANLGTSNSRPTWRMAATVEAGPLS